MQISKAYLLFASPGTILAISKYDSILNPGALEKLKEKGLNKFISFELPVDSVKASYQAHFAHVINDPHLSDEFIILDDDNDQIFLNIDFKELRNPVYFQDGARVQVPQSV